MCEHTREHIHLRHTQKKRVYVVHGGNRSGGG